jgi:hypothetical protein
MVSLGGSCTEIGEEAAEQRALNFLALSQLQGRFKEMALFA